MDDIKIRPAEPADLIKLAAMCNSLWPDATAKEHARELAPRLAGQTPGNLPGIVLVAVVDTVVDKRASGKIEAGELGDAKESQVVGFVDVGLRSHADGCDPALPVGYLEGWYVMPAYRRKNVGARLATAAEEWARGHGCKEIASDTWIDEVVSQHVHEALGFEVVDRCVHYRKRL